MPKGDRLILKADPEDGTTPIANLLLEAVAMAKLSGLQKGVILYLWRRTYGWVEDGKRLKERKIPLQEWIKALDSEKSRTSKTLSELQTMNVIKRRLADNWGGYYYSINTNVKSWNSGCLNIAKLSEMITVGDFSTVGENDNSNPKHQQLAKTTTVDVLDKTTVGENATQQLAKTTTPTLYKEILNKDLKKDIAQQKQHYGEFNNVMLTDEEYKKLQEKFPESFKERIETLSTGIESKGYKYKSHYATILSWARMDEKKNPSGKSKENNYGHMVQQ